VSGVRELAFDVGVDDVDVGFVAGFSGAPAFELDPHAPTSRTKTATVTTGRTRMKFSRSDAGHGPRPFPPVDDGTHSAG
jgi:hypothetical protein